MSGRKQHATPQSLLKGFEILPRLGKIPKVWLFRKGQPPHVNSMKDAAAERDFYSEPAPDSSETLDDRITRYENSRFSRLISSLRRLSPGDPADPDEAAEVVGHLTARNAHLRATFRSTLEVLIAEAGLIFADEANLRLLFGADAASPSVKTQELLNQAIPIKPLSILTGLPGEIISQIAFTLMKENFSAFYAEIGPAIRTHFSALTRTAGKSIREGHNRALGKNLSADRQVGILRNLSWSTFDALDGGLILPDCIALGFEDDSPDAVPYIMTADDHVTCVLMPLSSSQTSGWTTRSGPFARSGSFQPGCGVLQPRFLRQCQQHARSGEPSGTDRQAIPSRLCRHHLRFAARF